MPRYTRMVDWFLRTATLVLILLLGSGPAIAAVCQAICLPPAAADDSGSDATAHSEHHHPTPVHEHAGAKRATAQQITHGRIDTTAGAHHSQPRQLRGLDCCRAFALPRYSLAASRVDANLLPASHTALLLIATILTVTEKQTDQLTHAPPPVEPSPVRSPLVLRI